MGELAEGGGGEGEFEAADAVEDDGDAVLAIDLLDGALEIFEDGGFRQYAIGELDAVVDLGDNFFGVFHRAIGYLKDLLQGTDLSIGDAGKVGKPVGCGQQRGIFPEASDRGALFQDIDTVGLIDPDEDLAVNDDGLLGPDGLGGSVGLYLIGLAGLTVDKAFGVVEEGSAGEFGMALDVGDVPGRRVEDLFNLWLLFRKMEDLVVGEAAQAAEFSSV